MKVLMVDLQKIMIEAIIIKEIVKKLITDIIKVSGFYLELFGFPYMLLLSRSPLFARVKFIEIDVIGILFRLLVLIWRKRLKIFR
jgi:hypothetical protein